MGIQVHRGRSHGLPVHLRLVPLPIRGLEGFRRAADGVEGEVEVHLEEETETERGRGISRLRVMVGRGSMVREAVVRVDAGLGAGLGTAQWDLHARGPRGDLHRAQSRDPGRLLDADAVIRNVLYTSEDVFELLS